LLRRRYTICLPDRIKPIHDGLLDDIPKAYKVIEAGKAVEKFVLLPDRGPEGRFEKYKNRNLFYNRDDRVNLRLPGLISGFQSRQVATLAGILGTLKITDKRIFTMRSGSTAMLANKSLQTDEHLGRCAPSVFAAERQVVGQAQE
jgi:hypothetical protein